MTPLQFRRLRVLGRLRALSALSLSLALLTSGGLARKADAQAPPATPAPVKPAAPTPVPVPPVVAPAVPADSSPEYVVGIDDVIGIFVIGHEELTQAVPVLSDGKIHVAGIEGDIKADGLTLAKLKDEIRKGLDRLYNNLELSITLRESHSKTVTIVGARVSGQYPLRKEMRISTLVAAAGGLVSKNKLTLGTLVRDFQTTKLDMEKILGSPPDVASDIPLKIGDLVLLVTLDEPTLEAYTVLGSVLRPGPFPLPKDGTPVTLTRALADAGGPMEKASLTRATLQRNGKNIPLNLYPLLVEGKADTPEGRIFMQNGDSIIIPEVTAKYTVLGQTNRPGTYPIQDNKPVTVLQALAEGGGANQGAELRKVVLVHTENGTTTRTKMDLQRMANGSDLKSNLIMQNGDVLFVPQKGHNVELQDILNPFFYLSSLGFRPFGR